VGARTMSNLALTLTKAPSPVFGINGFLPIHTAGNRGEEALSSLASELRCITA